MRTLCDFLTKLSNRIVDEIRLEPSPKLRGGEGVVRRGRVQGRSVL